MAKGPKQIKLGAGGWWRNPNNDGAPQDALLVAQNIEYTATGGAQTRGPVPSAAHSSGSWPTGWDQGNLSSSFFSGVQSELHIRPYDGQPLGSATWATVPGFTQTRDAVYTGYTSDLNTRAVGAVNQPIEFVGGVHYFLTDRGVFFSNPYGNNTGSPEATVGGRAGFDPIDPGPDDTGSSQTMGTIFTLNNTTGLNWFATSKKVAYRFVLVWKRPLGDLVFGPPSPRVELINDSAGTRYVTGTVTLPVSMLKYTSTTDGSRELYLQVYRSSQYATSATPDDELRLVAEVSINEGDYDRAQALTGYSTYGKIDVSFTDVTSDTTRGAYIYTAPSQSGILESYYKPPVAAAMTVHQDRVFYAPHKQPGQYTLDIGTVLNCSAAHNTSSNQYFSLSTAGKFAGADAVAWTDSGTGSGSNKIFVDTTGSTTPGAVTGLVGWAIYESSYIYEGTVITAVESLGSNVYRITLSQDHNSPGGSFTPTIYPTVLIDGLYYAPSKDAWADFAGFGDETDTKLIAQSLSQRISRGADMRVIAYEDSSGSVGSDTLASEAPSGWYTGSVTSQPGTIFVRIDEKPNDTHTVTGYGGATFSALDGAQDNYIYFSEVSRPEQVKLTSLLQVGLNGSYTLGIRSFQDSLFVFRTDGIFVVSGNDPSNYYIRQLSPTDICCNPRSLVVTPQGIVGAFQGGFMLVNLSGVQNIGQAVYDPQTRLEYRAGTNAILSACYDSNRNACLFVIGVSIANGEGGSLEQDATPIWYLDMSSGRWAEWTLGATELSVPYQAFRLREVEYSSNEGMPIKTLAGISPTGTTIVYTLQATASSLASVIQWNYFLAGDPAGLGNFDQVVFSFSQNALSQLDLTFYSEYLPNETVTTTNISIDEATYGIDDRRILTTLVPLDNRLTSRLAIQAAFTGTFSLDGLAISYQPYSGFILR